MEAFIVIAFVLLAIYLAGIFSRWNDPNVPTDARDWWPVLPPKRHKR